MLLRRLLKQIYFTCLLLTSNAMVSAQALRNEWIDYNKTYYRFFVTPSTAIPSLPNQAPASNLASPGDYNMLHRIPFSTLQQAGLSNTPVEQLQFWRNGQEIAVFTSPSTGIMDASGFIEFWGEHNDGKTDKDLYRFGHFQTNTRWSLFSDTSYYYITVNPSGTNKRIVAAPNNVAGSTLTPDSFFMHTIAVNPRVNRYLGTALNISGAEVRSSTFDAGEGWGITRNGGAVYNIALNGLFPHTGTDSLMRLAYWAQSGTNGNYSFEIRLNDSIIGAKLLRRYASDSAFYTAIPLSRLTAGNTIIGVRPSTLNNAFNYNLSKVLLTYPRRFEFTKTNNATFAFSLPANAAGNLLKIVNFEGSENTKILIDRTNNKRYEAQRVVDTLWFALEPSTVERSLVLVTLNTTNPAVVRPITTLTARTFTNYSLPANQGDYLIISNNLLYNDNGTNRVEEYRAYRSSAAGGQFNAKIYEINDLTEQFAFNILKNPLAIRNFLKYARSTFSVTPKSAFIIGRGSTYDYPFGSANAANLNVVPTWGQPASDNLLAADNNEAITPITPIGRLAAITGAEVKDYLEKVKSFEGIQKNPAAKNGWQKTTLHLIGSNDEVIVAPIKAYMQGWENILSDTLVGAKVYTYARNNPNTSQANQEILNQIKTGAGIISYFGHSSATSLDFNLNKPEELDITPGHLPVMIANGCKASEFFDLNSLRYNQTRLTLSEKFVLSKTSGSIAFLSSTTVGILQYLDVFSSKWYTAAATSHYGKSLGEIHKEAIRLMQLQSNDQPTRLTAEEFHLHGDPAIRIHTQVKPDYAIDSNNIVIAPLPVSVANDSVRFSFTLTNQGQAIRDSIDVRVNRILPSGQNQLISQYKIGNITNSRSFSGAFAIRGDAEAGHNQLSITLDASNKIDELDESNNIAIKSFNIDSKGLTPIVPTDFGIVNTWPSSLIASTFDSNLDSGLYRMELDTTRLFNSPLLFTMEANSKNGVISFLPNNTLISGKTYYWRTAEMLNGIAGTWRSASFTYLPTETPGFNQGHFYQHLQSSYKTMVLDSASRSFAFTPRSNNLYITHGIFSTSGTEDGHFSVTPNGITNIYSACIGKSIIFNVFDSLSFQPWLNLNQGYGSAANCGNGRQYNFEFNYAPASNRKKIMDFMDAIPTGHYVVARMVVDPPHDSTKVEYWKRDTAIYGVGQSLYHRFMQQGFYDIDSMTRVRTFSVVYRQNDTTNFKPKWVLSDGLYDRPAISVDIPMIDTTGSITSPWIGPAKQWDNLKWNGIPDFVEENTLVTDSLQTLVLGRRKTGVIDTLFTLPVVTKNLAFAGANSIDATTYPFIQLQQKTNDSDNATPYPLDFWRVNFQPAPEGALAPADYFAFTKNHTTGQYKDTLELGRDTLQFGIAFKNIGNTAFTDSLTATVSLEDSVGNKLSLLNKKIKWLPVGDSAMLYVEVPITAGMLGSRSIYASINGEQQIPELSYLNNTMYRKFYVVPSSVAPNTKIFNGTGNWSDPGKWLPIGVPVCSDKVIINGNCTVDIANAVSDSLWINPSGVLNIHQGSGSLNLGCNSNGGNKLMQVSGSLHITDGELVINGGLLFTSGSSFVQSGGSIEIDPNTNDAASSLLLSHYDEFNNIHPVAALAFGGRNNTEPGAPTAPFVLGNIALSGGTITVIDPPFDANALAIFLGNVDGSSLSIDSAHHIRLGPADPARASNVSTNQLKVWIAGNGSTGKPALGSITISTPPVPQRGVHILNLNEPYVLHIWGKLMIEANGILKVDPNIELKFGKH